MNLEAYNYLHRIDAKHWSRHAFNEMVKNEHVTNNCTESFNSWLKKARGKPILSMLEYLRRKLMGRMQSRYQKGLAWEGKVTYEVRKRIEKTSNIARMCTVIFAGGEEYEVFDDGINYVVDLCKKTCGCKAWQVGGIPCKHAMAAIRNKRANPEDYVDSYFLKQTYLMCYGDMIHPVPHESEWPNVTYDPIGPPEVKRGIGRPKKTRCKEPGETSAT